MKMCEISERILRTLVEMAENYVVDLEEESASRATDYQMAALRDAWHMIGKDPPPYFERKYPVVSKSDDAQV